MTLSTWWQLLDLYEVILVWPLALVTLYLTVKARTRRGRIAGASLLVLWFAPFIHRAAGDIYFDYLCKHEAGEFIYRTVDNVEGILQMRPRDGSKDYFDRMSMGDIPEDPWGHTNREAETPWNMIGSYKFIEIPSEVVPSRHWGSLYDESMYAAPKAGYPIARYSGYDGRDLRSIRKELFEHSVSRYGFTWLESTGFAGWLFNVHAGEIRVLDLMDSSLLATKKGFYRARPTNICPHGKDDRQTQEFLERVLHPSKKPQVSE